VKCPGQDTQYWKPGAIFEVPCPKCGQVVEFFKDDTSRKCSGCGHRFVNPNMDFGCAAYCQYAEQCIGNLPAELMAQKEDLLKDRVAIEMKRYFKTDFKRIGHAMRVARHAEQIGKSEQGNLAVILTAAYLHDIGFPESERKHGAAASEYHESEGPAVARSVLVAVGAREELIDEVCDMIAHHHHPGSEDSVNFKVLYDADLLENLDTENKRRPMDPAELTELIRRSFLTDGGRKLARELLVK
jgi:putative nucleotidyltransferase with HDIG domain